MENMTSEYVLQPIIYIDMIKGMAQILEMRSWKFFFA